MRRICQICNNKIDCSYLKRNKEDDCIDVQTSDYGYFEASLKALGFLEEALNGDNIEGCRDSKKLIEDFKNYMEI